MAVEGAERHDFLLSLVQRHTLQALAATRVLILPQAEEVVARWWLLTTTPQLRFREPQRLELVETAQLALSSSLTSAKEV